MQLKVRNLTKQYEKNEPPALDQVNLDIGAGEFVAVLGLSGSGKSSFIRCINRLVEPTEGIIEFEGQSVTALRREGLRMHRRSIGMIFQHYNLIPRLDVLTNVLVGIFGSMSTTRILLKRFPESGIDEGMKALRKVGMESYGKRKVGTLSGGQQQRAGIARALIQRPKMILGDEPVASLDPVTAKDVMTLLREINEKEGITMIINLHSIEIAKTFATRIIGLNRGRVVFDGPAEALTEEKILHIYKDRD